MSAHLSPDLPRKPCKTGLCGLFITVLLFFCITATFGCRGVEHHQKGRFSSAIMSFDPDGSEIHFHQKTYYSREGSAGGIGAAAGGGCGCY
ncbi:MAG: hypothetical protein CMJ99_09385 [Planctomycetes bacterium]|nr:hypothetical protein [Planctomycetota bacterium]